MEEHRYYSDEMLLEALETASLDPSLFTHEAHLRWGWLLLERNNLQQAIDKACSQLKAYTRSLGVAEKYNETVTVAAIRAIYHFRLRSKARSFDSFIQDTPKLSSSFKELMAAHYSENIFNSEMARKKYIDPDLLPFD